MKSFALMGAALALGLTLVAGDADAAKRFGGGKSSGMQRQELSQPKAPTATPATPAQAPGAAAQAQPKRSWMGPLAGLAAGIGLAALASHFGFGEELASMMMMALIAFAVIAVIGFFLRKRAAANQPALAGAGAGVQGMQYTAKQADYGNAAAPATSAFGGGAAAPVAGAAAAAAAAATAGAGAIPADFDAETFVRNAKVNFIRLQAANDARNLEDIREYTTPEMFAEIKMNWMEHGTAPQKTDVVSLNAEVIDVAEEAERYVVSVRFTGLLREEANAAPEGIDEIWHLTKPRSGNAGWLVAGVQQNV
ncbi:Tim44-like domain-containing protein [Zoogloea sp.]|uniref:Tim44 domain-containing protein n=1 Tax=Zoogloea sp. TaxID=49181 RepID=UPI001415ED3F|nr:MAG: Tim44 domain-containing protein [Zoogloea sp.]